MNYDELSRLLANAGEKPEEEKSGSMDDDLIDSPWVETPRPPKTVKRPVRIGAIAGEITDPAVVSYPLYNSFNYSLFTGNGIGPMKMSLGVTSPNYGEGKTTTVCNLGAAIAMGSGKKTVVVDFSLTRPRVHEVFGTPRGPGLAEALVGEDICVVPTQLDNLFALPVGNTRMVPPNKLPVFREILTALFTDFEFVIVDMPPAAAKSFPTLIANQLSGLLVVVRSRVTKRREINRLFRKVREESVLGFVMNGINENDF